MSKWLVSICGDEADLSELEKSLREPGMSVSRETGSFVLRCADFDYETDAVSDIQAARKELLDRGVEISEVFHDAAGVYAGTDEPYLFGRVRLSGPDPEHHSYRSFASFRDPDGNGWLFQELTTRLPGRIDPATTAFASANDLASALRRAEAAHGQHEKRAGQRDANWPEQAQPRSVP